ncbi:RsmB/NOP family class I SAM-dependent RNA methyltransferase [Candidatus Woesearchaeota archaeon]|nr:MAG: RsmB/NOP family class I SAM-dependent RNA methyltransferase [Candidatus Woesearchaeota archaeon]
MEVKWKPKFIERYSKLTDIDRFLEYSLKPLPKTIRVNTLKTTIKEVQSRMPLTAIPWCKEGFITQGYTIGNTKEHFLGYIYLQGAASMIPPVVLNPKPKDMVLDMCASPGSKTSQMAAMMKNRGIIVANDLTIDRMQPLTFNLQRLGVRNTVITRMDGRWFKDKQFDKILLDAPCSGIGTIRKSLKTIKMWNPGYAKMMSGLQKRLFDSALNVLKDSGTLVYSTCTLEPEENEGVVDAMLSKHENLKLKKISLDIKRSDPVLEWEGKEYDSEIKKCLRIWPQDNDTEGFFVAKFEKV